MVTGVVEANPGVGLPRLWVTDAKQQPLKKWVHVTSVKGFHITNVAWPIWGFHIAWIDLITLQKVRRNKYSYCFINPLIWK
jgi:hypothetical protein